MNVRCRRDYIFHGITSDTIPSTFSFTAHIFSLLAYFWIFFFPPKRNDFYKFRKIYIRISFSRERNISYSESARKGVQYIIRVEELLYAILPEEVLKKFVNATDYRCLNESDFSCDVDAGITSDAI